jgi:WD40 repeat protein
MICDGDLVQEIHGSDYINFHNTKQNQYTISSSYNINQITNVPGTSTLFVKCRNVEEEGFAVVNSNFQINYLTFDKGGLFNTTFEGHSSRVNEIAFFKDASAPLDQTFLSASSDGTIKLWDMKASHKPVYSINTGKAVASIDTNQDAIVAAYGLEIGVWDIKTLKLRDKPYKMGHSDTITSVRLRGNQLISTGLDNLINVYDISNGLEMESVIGCVNLNQAINMGGFLDPDCNFISALTTVFTYNIIDMNRGYSIFEYDARNVIYLFI